MANIAGNDRASGEKYRIRRIGRLDISFRRRENRQTHQPASQQSLLMYI